MKLYHECLATIFKPLLEAYDAGGFYVDFLGEVRCLLPVLAFFAQDNKEGDTLCGTISGPMVSANWIDQPAYPPIFINHNIFLPCQSVFPPSPPRADRSSMPYLLDKKRGAGYARGGSGTPYNGGSATDS
jgi:hypothetical protein